MTNPLLTDWTTAFGLPPFTDISDDDFAPAVDAALETARANITKIAESAETATFDNTVVALELADAQLGRVLGAFYALAGADSNTAREGLQRGLGLLQIPFCLSGLKICGRVVMTWN